MICPNCFKEITYVFAYSVRLWEAPLNEEGEVKELVNPIDRTPQSFVCPECDEEIKVKCEIEL